MTSPSYRHPRGGPLVMSLREERSFAPDYWDEFMARRETLDRVILFGELTVSKFFGKYGNLSNVAGLGARLLSPADLEDKSLVKGLFPTTWFNAPGLVIFRSRDESHAELLAAHYEADFDIAPEWFEKGKAAPRFSAHLQAASVDVDHSMFVWCFTWDADAAILRSPEPALSEDAPIPPED